MPRYRLNKRQSGPWTQSGRYGEEINLSPAGIRNQNRPGRTIFILQTKPSRLHKVVGTNYTAPSVVLFTLPLLPLFYVQIFSQTFVLK